MVTPNLESLKETKEKSDKTEFTRGAVHSGE